MARYRSGQTGQTVNLLAYAFGGSTPSLATSALLAQLVERIHGKDEVTGSNPVEGSRINGDQNRQNDKR
jgi:hypothetical protein